jgi:hypothetical protein
MSSYTGLSPKDPNKYLGPNVYLSSIVTRNREPTGADYRQPETGKIYPLGSYWLISRDPVTGTQGDLWYLSKIVANVAYWLQVSSGGSGTLIDIQVDAVTAPGVNPVTPLLGEIDFNGAAVANHGVPVETRTRALHAMNLEVQYATSAAATDATLSGLAHYNSGQFSVDASGFVALLGSGTNPALQTLTGDSGGAIAGNASNNINIKSDANFTGLGGTGIITGASNQLTFQLTLALASPQPIGTTAPSTGRFTGMGIGIAPPVSGIELASSNGIKYDTSAGGTGTTPTTNTQLIYEEGNYTPTLTGGTVAGTTTYTAQVGRYVRIGNWVWIQYAVAISAATGTGDANFSVPFICQNTSIVPLSQGAKQDVATSVLNIMQCTVNPSAAVSHLRAEGSTTVYQMENAAKYYSGSLFYRIA